MSKRWAALVATCAVVSIGLFAACGGDDEPSGGGGGDGATTAATTNLAECQGTIGVMVPITGDAASIGEEQRNWARFAVERFNADQGTTFELEEGDTQLDPGQASTVAQQFVSNDAILAVIGPAGSQEVEAAGPIFERGDLAFVSQSATATNLTEGKYPTFSRVVPPDSVQAPTDATYMAETLSAKKVLVVDDQTSYSTGLADGAEAALKEAGVTVSRESVNQKRTDYSALASKVAADVDVVFLPWQIAANAQQFGEQLKEQGKDVTIFGSDGLFSPKDFKIDGSYVSSFAPDIKNIASSKELSDAYQAKYKDFGTFGPPTYVAAEVAMTAIVEACKAGGNKAERTAVGEQISNVNLAESVLGQPVAFDEKGDLKDAKFFIFKVENGSYTLAE